MLYEFCILMTGLYIGKYYPQYVPLPKITKEQTDNVLQYLSTMQAKLAGVSAQTTAQTTPA